MKVKWTLYRKIQLIIILIMLLIFVISQVTLSQLINNSIRNNFEDNVINTSMLLQENFEVIFSDANNTLNFLKKQYENSFRDDDYIRDYLEVLIETKYYIVNSFVAYNDGTYVLTPHVDLVNFDPRVRPWYASAYETKSMVWSEPYTDIVTGDLVITGSVYLKLKKTDGVLGLDIRLKSLPGVINTTRISENGYILLVNDEDKIIVDTKGFFTNESLRDINDDALVESRLITGTIETDKGLYFMRRLSQTNMRLIAFLPYTDLNDAARKVQLIFSIVIIIAVIAGGFISYFFARRITKPIEELTSTMIESQTEEELIRFNYQTNDEINTLIEGYNSLADSVNKQNKELKAVSVELKKSENKLQEQYDRVAELAYFDHLTGLPNRLKFEQQTKLLINDKTPFSLFYIDLDDFKYINDTYGHNYGDFVLQIVSRRFKNCCEGEFFGSRLSGDEFGLLIPNKTSAEIEEIAIKLLGVMQKSITFNDLEFNVTGSIGICSYPVDGRSFEDIMANADIAMYEAKLKSKNQYMIFNQVLRTNLIDRVNIETQMRTAIEKGEFFLCYQPLLDLKSKKVKGLEALVRWKSEEMGMIYPNTFIPIAEHNLFINPLGYFVMEEAIKFGKHLYERFGEYFEVNVNVSIVQLHLEEFSETVLSFLEKYNYPPECLNLEITESVALDKDNKIRDKLMYLRTHGIKLSLDDFGTGYSSFNHLLSISLTHLKIDRSIIGEATEKLVVKKLVQGIVEFAHAVDIRVIAEGIENETSEKMVEEMNIDTAQGYKYAKPLEESEFIKYLEKN